MPNRILRESIRTSNSLSHLTAEEERHFYRLLVFADDFGRFDARPQVVKGFCYSLAEVTTEQVMVWSNRLSDPEVEIVQLYEVNDLPYGRFINWDKYQRTRAKESKYPQPQTSDNICLQMPTYVAVDVFVVEDVIGDVIVGKTEGTGADAPTPAKEKPKKTKEPWLPEEWFEPVTKLKGYKAQQNHDQAQSVVKSACERAKVEPSKVITAFSTYFPQGQIAHGWKDPVQDLVRTLEIQIN